MWEDLNSNVNWSPFIKPSQIKYAKVSPKDTWPENVIKSNPVGNISHRKSSFTLNNLIHESIYIYNMVRSNKSQWHHLLGTVLCCPSVVYYIESRDKGRKKEQQNTLLISLKHYPSSIATFLIWNANNAIMVSGMGWLETRQWTTQA